MDIIRDLVESVGLQPEHFSYLIILVAITGGIWGAIRLYQDLTGPVRDIYQPDYFDQRQHYEDEVEKL